MAALPENYVSLQQLKERWTRRDVRGDDRERSLDGRRQESLSGKVREEHTARDIADRQRSYYFSQNKVVGGGEGRSRRDPDAAFAEGFAVEWGCAGRSESKIGYFATAPEDGRKLPREKEIEEFSCFASAVVKDSNGNEVKRGEGWAESSDQRRTGFNKLGSGPVRAKESGSGGNRPRPFWRNNASGKDDGGRRREPAAPAVEPGALEQPSPRRLDSEVRWGAQKSAIVPEDGSSNAVVEESGAKEVKSEVLHNKNDKSKSRRYWKHKKEVGAVGAEEGQGGGNWRRPQFQRNEDGHRGDGRSPEDVVASVVEIMALGRRGPRRSHSEVIFGDKMPNAVPEGGLESPPEKGHVESVCFPGAVVQEGCAKEMKSEEYERKSGGGCSWRRCNKERKKPGVVKGKDQVDNLADDGHTAPVEAAKEECWGNQMNSMEDLKRSNNYQRKDPKKKKSGLARIIEEGEQMDKLADGHNMPLEAVALPGGKESVASEGKYLGVNSSGNGRGVISGPRKNGLSCRERVVVREDIEIQEDFAGDKESVSKEVEPANKSSGTEGNLGNKQKNDISSKEMVFCSDEGEVMRKFSDFSIGSSGRREGRERRLPLPRAENSHSWRRGNSKRENGVSASRMERDLVWVKKGDALGGNKAADFTRAH